MNDAICTILFASCCLRLRKDKVSSTASVRDSSRFSSQTFCISSWTSAGKSFETAANKAATALWNILWILNRRWIQQLFKAGRCRFDCRTRSHPTQHWCDVRIKTEINHTFSPAVVRAEQVGSAEWTNTASYYYHNHRCYSSWLFRPPSSSVWQQGRWIGSYLVIYLFFLCRCVSISLSLACSGIHRDSRCR